ncbi:MAG TPA: TlpA disulfide reductase family protein [Edaphobacter sp.]|nr:TlpA disulfide reductase family protein [Edaphobacter sp.]
MAQHYGHGTPPISPMLDMNKKPFLLGSVKGYWTLLYYWADWCIPCIEKGIPDLTSFVQQTTAQHSKYRIVAIRFNSLDESGDWSTFKAKTEHLEKTLWHGIPPFPIVYDSTTHMTSDWGVHELPTYALIDPEGNLVPHGDLAVLRKAIKIKGR